MSRSDLAVIGGALLLSLSCASRETFARVSPQAGEARIHSRLRVDGRNAGVSTTIIRGYGPESVAIRLREPSRRLMLVDWANDGSGIRWTVRGAGLSRELGVATRGRQGDVSEVTIGGLSWELRADVTDETMLAVRSAIRRSLSEQDLVALDHIRVLMQGTSYLEWIACPVDPVRSNLHMWRCGTTTSRVEAVALSPDCGFDASVGFPCSKDREANVRAAKRRGKLLEQY